MKKFYTARERFQFLRNFLDKKGVRTFYDLSDTDKQEYADAYKKKFKGKRFIDLNDYSWKGRYGK